MTKEREKFTVKTLAESVGQVVGGYSAERFTGRVVIEVDMREGGIGRVGVNVSSTLQPGKAN